MQWQVFRVQGTCESSRLSRLVNGASCSFLVADSGPTGLFYWEQSLSVPIVPLSAYERLRQNVFLRTWAALARQDGPGILHLIHLDALHASISFHSHRVN